MDPQISARSLTLGYGRRAVLEGLDLEVGRGEFLSVIGPSGVGKSTLLMALNATTSILSGTLTVLGQRVDGIGPGEMKRLRARIGVIFQGYNLVGRLSVLDNVASGLLSRKSVPAALIKHYTRAEYDEILEYLRVVGLEDEALSRCDRLSGGQRQRVAIARALAQRPEILLADEPISSLDPVSARRVMETLASANERYGITVLANLHQLDYARAFCRRTLGINAGRVVHDGPPEALDAATLEQIYRSPVHGAGRPPVEALLPAPEPT